MRTIALLREVSSTLESLGWSLREGASHSRGSVEVAAQRSWTREELQAVLHLLIIIDPTEGELAFADDAPTIDDAPIAFSLGDDDPEQRRALATILDRDRLAWLHATAYPREESITAPARVVAQPARRTASFAAGNDESLARAFDALDGVRDDLWKAAIEALSEDLEYLPEDAPAIIDPFLRRCDLLHAIVVTDRVMPNESVRLSMRHVVGAEHRWIDVVRSVAFADFASALTRHYDARLTKRNFTAASE
jgi:hypothetical protein